MAKKWMFAKGQWGWVDDNPDGEGDGSGDPGYEVITTEETIFDGNVTTATQEGGTEIGGQIPSEDAIDADMIRVIFNGQEYDCPRIDVGDNFWAYGGVIPETGPDFSQFPFAITVNSGTAYLLTEAAGTYPLKIAKDEKTVNTSPDFMTAVNSLLLPDRRMEYLRIGDPEVTIGNIKAKMSAGQLFCLYDLSDPQKKISLISAPELRIIVCISARLRYIQQ